MSVIINPTPASSDTDIGGELLLETGGFLQSTVGYVPAMFNMAPWGAFSTFTDFTSGLFTLFQATITTGAPAPDGTLTAQKLVEGVANNQHNVQANSIQGHTQTPIKYRIACIARAVERTRIVLFYQNFQDSTMTVSVGFDLAGGNVGYDTVVGANASLDGSLMTSLGNGWWLCQFDVHYTGAITPGGVSYVWLPQINIDNGTGTAPRSIFYIGNGTSGVEIFWLNMLPTAAWNITNQVLFDDFNSLSTIDINDTRAIGYNWYVHNRMPNSFMPTFGWTTNPPSAPTAASYLSLSSPSVLKILNPNTFQTGFTSQIWSVADNGSGGYIGQAWKGPLVFDAFISYDGLTADYNTNWAGSPAFWTAAVEAMTGQMGGATHFTEWDVLEGNPVSAGNHSGSTTIHDWSNPGSPTNFQFGGALGINASPGVFHRFSGIFLNTAATGTAWGIYLNFFDGQFVNFGDTAYSASAVPQGGTAPVGTLSAGDTQTYPVLFDTGENTLGGGGGWAMFIDWVRIYKG